MNENEFYQKIESIFMERSLPIPEFNYSKEINGYIAPNSLVLDDIAYTVIVREDGMIVYGYNNRDEFIEKDIIGHI